MTKLTTDSLTTKQIRALQMEAGEAGDLDMVAICRRAAGDDEQATQTEITRAQQAVCDVINNARAQS